MKFNEFINKYFDQVYVINLDTRPDRMEIVSDLLSSHKIKYKRMSGVYLKDKYTDVRNVHTTTSSLGIIGCLLSHLKCLQDGKDNNYKKILILEDDITFLDEHISQINFDTLNNELDNVNWDFFYLGATFNGKLNKLTTHLAEPTGEVWATQSIGYNESMIDKLLSCMPQDPEFYITPERQSKVVPVDLIYLRSFKHKIKVAVNPIICIQNATPSDIVPEHLFQDNGEYQLARWHRNKP